MKCNNLNFYITLYFEKLILFLERHIYIAFKPSMNFRNNFQNKFLILYSGLKKTIVEDATESDKSLFQNADEKQSFS